MKTLICLEDAIDALVDEWKYKPDDEGLNCYNIKATLLRLPSAEPVKAYTKADYIMALHKEYGCTLTMAEEAHNKALEYLQSKARMKGEKNEHID